MENKVIITFKSFQMKKLFVLFLVSMAIIHLNLSAQIDKGKNFYQIAETMNRHFKNEGKDAAGYKQFKRWEWYYSTRIGKDGLLVDNAGLNKKAYLSGGINRRINTNSPAANSGAWVPLGPSYINSTGKGIGRANRLAFHPTDANTLFLATASGGLWKTTNAGTNWYPLTDGIPNLCMSGVAVHPSNGNIIYILTGDADAGGGGNNPPVGKYSSGVLKSYDGGLNWTYTGLQWSETQNYLAYKLVIHPTNPEVLLVVTNKGIFRTSDGGANWVSSNTGFYFCDIEFKPGDPSIMYTAGHYNDGTGDVNLYKSTDHGVSFSVSSTIASHYGSNNLNRVALAVSPANANYVYALVGPAAGAGVFRGIYRSTNQGVSFTLRTQTPNILGRAMAGDDDEHQSTYDLCMVISPTNINTIATGGIRLWTSINGGTTMVAHNENVSTSNYYHGDLHDLIYHPLNNNLLYMIGDGGIYKSTDDGDSWNDANGTGLQITQYYKIGTDVSNVINSQNIMIGGNQDNGTNKRGSAGGSVFIRLDGSDGMDCYIDPDGNANYIWSKQNGIVIKSYSSGLTDVPVCSPGSINYTPEATWCTPIAEVTGNTTEFFIGYKPLTLVTDIAGVFSFQPFYHGGGGAVSGKTFVRTARGNASRVYAGDNDMSGGGTQRAYTSSNKGVSWTEIYAGYSEVPFTDLTFNADNGSEMWLSFGGYDASKKVMYSNNGGSSWTNVTGSLPNVPVNCIVFDDNNGSPGGAIYIGTDIGVFYKDNNLGDWIPFSNGLPVVEVTDLEIHHTEGLLRAGTYGRGIWQTSLYSNCVANLTLNSGNTSTNEPYYFQASNTINSTAFHAGTGANVFYKAGVEMQLTPGFHAIGSVANVFRGYIGPCGGGVPSIVQPNRITGFLIE